MSDLSWISHGIHRRSKNLSLASRRRKDNTPNLGVLFFLTRSVEEWMYDRCISSTVVLQCILLDAKGYPTSIAQRGKLVRVMAYRDRLKTVPGALAERLYTAIQRYRNAWSRYKRPEDLRQLIRIFPNVTIREGYILDYIPMGGPKSSWIWPFAKPIMYEHDEYLPDELAKLARDQLFGMRGTPDGERIAEQTLYKYLRYPDTQLGIFEYAIFVMELWATKSEIKAREWLNLGLVFSRHRFDSLILKSQSTRRIRRPGVYEPTVRLDPGGGGKVQFLAYESSGWKRVFYLLLKVDQGGKVEREPGKVLVDLG